MKMQIMFENESQRASTSSQKKNDFSSAPEPMSGEIVHVAFGVDAGYFRGMGVTITSLVKHNPDLSFIFHVFAFAISDDSRRRMDELVKNYGLNIQLHNLSSDMLNEFSRFPCFAKHSLGTFIRLLIPNELAGIAKKVLYLDADLLCFGDVSELLQVDIENCVAAAALDEAETTVKTQVAELGIQCGHYFNAGVIYINVDKWVKAEVQNTALRILTSRELVFADQDALNMALDGQVKFIEEKWNYRYHLVDFLSKGQSKFDISDTFVFVHFTGPVKPWHNWCLHEAKAIFVDYQSMSPWSDMPLDGPRSSRDLKLFSKFLIRQNRIWEGVNWHIKYLGARFVQRLKSS